MPKYHVGIREVHVVTVEVEAEDEEGALKKAGRALEEGLDELMQEYSHTLDPDTWSVEKVGD